MTRAAALLVCLGLSSCSLLAPGPKVIDVATGGPVILDALEWAEASIPRDPELLPAEREIALRSVTLARELVEAAAR